MEIEYQLKWLPDETSFTSAGQAGRKTVKVDRRMQGSPLIILDSAINHLLVG